MPLNVEAGSWVQGCPVVYSKKKPWLKKLVMTTLKRNLATSFGNQGAVSVCMFCPTGAVLRVTPLLQIFSERRHYCSKL